MLEKIIKFWSLIVFALVIVFSLIVFYVKAKDLPSKVDKLSTDTANTISSLKLQDIAINILNKDMATTKTEIKEAITKLEKAQADTTVKIDSFIKEQNANQQIILRALGRLEGLSRNPRPETTPIPTGGAR